ncbi:hypothetical protein [Algoriphagus limi]|uniref:Uncharacterized protein n=1 Tax=Algoriphagus limi TaxID=2975273 RepID=A0ABT2G618_9BACT|nr:hypothetical protein [Algoriphagus limi]MCS5490708.1 hypothetical protein [Algoriphagus limi]
MKNLLKTAFSGLFASILLSLPLQSFAGWEFKSVESIDRMDGRTYIVTHCENKIGDDCTTPGSATRMDITPVVELLEGYGLIRKL